MSTRSKWQHLATEAVNPRSRDIDTLTPDEIVEVMILDNRRVLAAVQREKTRIARGAELLADAVLKGGRLIFVGAGTSGRLGVLEAAELPPTFGIDPEMAQAVMAGGPAAVHRAKEGVEDDFEAGERAMRGLRPTAQRCRHRHLGQRYYAVRAGCGGERTRGTGAHHRRHLRPAIGTEGSRRCCHHPRRGSRGHRRLDPAEGRHRNEDRPEHADDRGDGSGREDLRESDGGREVQLGQAARSRTPHHRKRHGSGLRRCGWRSCSGRSGT